MKIEYPWMVVLEFGPLISSIVLYSALCCSSNQVGTTSTLQEIAHLLRSDVRMIAIGDSYSTAFWARVGMAGLRVWPIPRISAIGGGAGIGPSIFRASTSCSPYETVLSADPLGYTVERHHKQSRYFFFTNSGTKRDLHRRFVFLG